MAKNELHLSLSIVVEQKEKIDTNMKMGNIL